MLCYKNLIITLMNILNKKWYYYRLINLFIYSIINIMCAIICLFFTFFALKKNFLRKSKIVKDDDTSFQDTGEYNYLFVPNIVSRFKFSCSLFDFHSLY